MALRVAQRCSAVIRLLVMLSRSSLCIAMKRVSRWNATAASVLTISQTQNSTPRNTTQWMQTSLWQSQQHFKHNMHATHTLKTDMRVQNLRRHNVERLTTSPKLALGLVVFTLVRKAWEYKKKADIARFGLFGSFECNEEHWWSETLATHDTRYTWWHRILYTLVKHTFHFFPFLFLGSSAAIVSLRFLFDKQTTLQVMISHSNSCASFQAGMILIRLMPSSIVDSCR